MRGNEIEHVPIIHMLSYKAGIKDTKRLFAKGHLLKTLISAFMLLHTDSATYLQQYYLTMQDFIL